MNSCNVMTTYNTQERPAFSRRSTSPESDQPPLDKRLQETLNPLDNRHSKQRP